MCLLFFRKSLKKTRYQNFSPLKGRKLGSMILTGSSFDLIMMNTNSFCYQWVQKKLWGCRMTSTKDRQIPNHPSCLHRDLLNLRPFRRPAFS